MGVGGGWGIYLAPHIYTSIKLMFTTILMRTTGHVTIDLTTPLLLVLTKVDLHCHFDLVTRPLDKHPQSAGSTHC